MGANELEDVLREVNEKGKFLAVLLTDHEGFPIAYAASGDYSPDSQAALIGLVRRATGQASEQLGVAANTEFTMLDTDGNLFVCRVITCNEMEMVLSFLIPEKNMPYRRLMTQTISSIDKLLNF